MKNGLFITSTGTEIGKTFITAALAHQMRLKGLDVTAIKPVISDFDENDPAGTDTAILAEALGLPLTSEVVNTLSPYRYRAPLAPSMAAELEGKTLDCEGLYQVCNTTIDQNSFTLIEGVGGSFVPLAGSALVADWIKALGLPSVVVTGSYLGTISHTIATIEAMQTRGLTIKAVIISETNGDGHPDPHATVKQIQALLDIPVFFVPQIEGPNGWTKTPDLSDIFS